MSHDEWLAEVRRLSNVHLRRYLETDGAVGSTAQGAPILILTTTGRKSGEQRSTPLIYGEDAGRYVVVASLGGHPRNPHWYLNLVADPEAEVQVKVERFMVRARTASGEERSRLWALMTEIWPSYDGYQGRTSRQIPVVVLEPGEQL